MNIIPTVSEHKTVLAVLDHATRSIEPLGHNRQLTFRIDVDTAEKFINICRGSGKLPSEVMRAWVETAVMEFNSVDM